MNAGVLPPSFETTTFICDGTKDLEKCSRIYAEQERYKIYPLALVAAAYLKTLKKCTNARPLSRGWETRGWIAWWWCGGVTRYRVIAEDEDERT